MSKCKYIEDGFKGKGVPFIIHVILYLLSIPYGLAVRLRLFLYGRGILKTHTLPCRVVSIGNITVGGTGKTPVTIALAREIQEGGRSVVILSRGYKSKGPSKDGMRVVSDENEILLTPRESGDEPYLMATKLPGVPIVVSSNRVKAGGYIMERFAPDIILLDDGFQHIRLYRDVNIMLVDARRGFGSGYLLPRGPLREPVTEIKRADIIMVKGAGDPNTPIDIPGNLPRFNFTYNASALTSLTDEIVAGALDDLSGSNVFIFTAIADPDSFATSVEALGANITGTLTFPDHHWFTQNDIDRLKAASQKQGEQGEQGGVDYIITTEKDAVRLGSLDTGTLPLVMLTIEASIERADELLRLILKPNF